MDMKQIKELMAAMEKSGLKRIRIKEEKGFEVEIEKLPEEGMMVTERHPTVHHFAPPVAAHPPHRPATPMSHEEGEKTAQPGNFVTSPMVGTFYTANSPDDPPFIKVGDMVEEGTTVCIIEAMKVMNEVKAGKKGKVAEILVSNAEPVEFGTKLFRIV